MSPGRGGWGKTLGLTNKDSAYKLAREGKVEAWKEKAPNARGLRWVFGAQSGREYKDIPEEDEPSGPVYYRLPDIHEAIAGGDLKSHDPTDVRAWVRRHRRAAYERQRASAGGAATQ